MLTCSSTTSANSKHTLPEPVTALPLMSRPVSANGMHAACTKKTKVVDLSSESW